MGVPEGLHIFFPFVLNDSQVDNSFFQKMQILMIGEKVTRMIQNYSSACSSPFTFRHVISQIFALKDSA